MCMHMYVCVHVHVCTALPAHEEGISQLTHTDVLGCTCRASYRIFSWRGNFFYIAGETMWLIDHSEGEGVGGGCALSHAAYSADCQIYIVGNAIISATGTAILFNLLGGGGNFFWVGKIPGPPPLCMKP